MALHYALDAAYTPFDAPAMPFLLLVRLRAAALTLSAAAASFFAMIGRVFFAIAAIYTPLMMPRCAVYASRHITPLCRDIYGGDMLAAIALRYYACYAAHAPRGQSGLRAVDTL